MPPSKLTKYLLQQHRRRYYNSMVAIACPQPESTIKTLHDWYTPTKQQIHGQYTHSESLMKQFRPLLLQQARQLSDQLAAAHSIHYSLQALLWSEAPHPGPSLQALRTDIMPRNHTTQQQRQQRPQQRPQLQKPHQHLQRLALRPLRHLKSDRQELSTGAIPAILQRSCISSLQSTSRTASVTQIPHSTQSGAPSAAR